MAIKLNGLGDAPKFSDNEKNLVADDVKYISTELTNNE
jgi:hypothetical protein